MQQNIAQSIRTKGSMGKLLNSDELYNKANNAVDNLNKIIDEVNSGQGTVGKFLKDPSLYNNANKMVANSNQLVADINAGKGRWASWPKMRQWPRSSTTPSPAENIADRLERAKARPAS